LSSLRVQEMQSSVLDEAEFYGYFFKDKLICKRICVSQ